MPVRILHIAACLGLWLTIQSASALDSSVVSGMEARGSVDLDDFGPLPAISERIETIDTQPFPASSVSVADASPGFYSYSASADIGLLELKVMGSLTNTDSTPIQGLEIGALRSSAEVRDVLTVESSLPDPFEVTFEMIVHGDITGGGNAMANAGIIFGEVDGIPGYDTGTYRMESIDDTLSVTRTVSGSSVDLAFTVGLGFRIFEVSPGATVTGDLGNTATFRLILPQGVTLADSASSTYAVQITPVPEPGTWAMMLSGLAMFGARFRRAGLRPAAV